MENKRGQYGSKKLQTGRGLGSVPKTRIIHPNQSTIKTILII